MLTRIKRILKAAFVNFYRNIWLSLTATLIMTLAVLTVGVFLILALSTNKITQELKDKVDIVVNFKDEASESLIQQLKSDLIVRPTIKSVRYISKEEALEEFKARQSVKSEIREIVTPEDNPLPRGLQIQSVELQDYETFVAPLLKNPSYAPYIDSSSYDDNKELISNVDNAAKFVQKLGLALSIFFIAISALVVFNTVRLALLFRSEEIEVMRLVGASDSFVKLPFLIEGLLCGLFAVFLANLLTVSAIKILAKMSEGTVFESLTARATPVYSEELFFIVITQIMVAIIVGLGASYLSIRKNAKI